MLQTVIYVVEFDGVDESWVCGVFSSSEKAQAYKEEYKGSPFTYSSLKIKMFNLDEEVNPW